jgi:hypothetical protein
MKKEDVIVIKLSSFYALCFFVPAIFELIN